MKILVINGPNLNMVGIREPEIYGHKTYSDLVSDIEGWAKEMNHQVRVIQSNFEGEIVTEIQKAYKLYDGIIINAGAYTHTSVAILDALKAVAIPTVEVHLSDINSREEFRKLSYVSMAAEKTICGKGFLGYQEAMKYFLTKEV